MCNVWDNRTLTGDTSRLLIFISLSLLQASGTKLCCSHAHRACRYGYTNTVVHFTKILSQSGFQISLPKTSLLVLLRHRLNQEAIWLAVSLFFIMEPMFGSQDKGWVAQQPADAMRETITNVFSFFISGSSLPTPHSQPSPEEGSFFSKSCCFPDVI